jgi:hypothetical protein
LAKLVESNGRLAERELGADANPTQLAHRLALLKQIQNLDDPLRERGRIPGWDKVAFLDVVDRSRCPAKCGRNHTTASSEPDRQTARTHGRPSGYAYGKSIALFDQQAGARTVGAARCQELDDRYGTQPTE